MRKQILALLFACGTLQAQEAPTNLFIPPFDFPLYLSGNFGELRANHFHGGVDFKTEGVEGKPLYCIADGYISRISVSPGGYGNALYITHKNGFTSVHGHLKGFYGPIADFVERYQYEHETFAVDLELDSLQFPYKQGQQVAWSGNTGYSFGPHLHMEIRKTETNEPIDPLQFYVNKVKDTKAPIAKAIMFYPQRGKGLVNDKWSKQSFAITPAKGGNCLSVPVEAWGEIGLGIKANDYMDGTSNNYGVRSVTLFVDSAEVFNSTIDRYSFDENRMLNSWTDFEEFKRHNSWFMKSFIDPGNTLRALHADHNRGIIRIDEEKEYRFLYVLKDLYGNTSRYRFTVKGKKQNIPEYNPIVKHYLHWDRTNIVREPGMQLNIPRGMLYENIPLNCKVSTDSNAIAFDYQLHDAPVPLHNYCDLMIGIRNLPIQDTTKYYVVRKIGKAKYSAGGKYENGWMKTSIRELGTYSVAIDTVPPRIEAINKATWGRAGVITYKIGDGQSGVKSYKGKIDGQFALFAFSSKNARLSCVLNSKRIKKGGKHTLELIIEDYCGNIRRIEETFTW